MIANATAYLVMEHMTLVVKLDKLEINHVRGGQPPALYVTMHLQFRWPSGADRLRFRGLGETMMVVVFDTGGKFVAMTAEPFGVAWMDWPYNGPVMLLLSGERLQVGEVDAPTLTNPMWRHVVGTWQDTARTATEPAEIHGP